MKLIKLFILTFTLVTVNANVAWAEPKAVTQATENIKTMIVKLKDTGSKKNLTRIVAVVEKLKGVASCETSREGVITILKIKYNPLLIKKSEINATIEGIKGYESQKKNDFKVKIIDKKTDKPLADVNVFIRGLNIGSISDSNGVAVIQDVPKGTFKVRFSFIGYKSIGKTFTFPLAEANEVKEIQMEPEAFESKEVVITSTRTETRIENTPQKVEVLGSDELFEHEVAAPGNISDLLSEMPGIHVQQTSPTTGNMTFKIQGLPGRYTQMLMDGFPLYGNFSSGLSVLEIPPLNLQQVEVIKGPSSVLYGGGAIGGIVNLITKKPKKEPELDVILNQSQKGESDISGYYAEQKGKLGITALAGYSHQKPEDLNGDGFTDIPKYQTINFAPKVFYSFNKSTNISLGVTLLTDNREGGDLSAIENGVSAQHNYVVKNKSTRFNTLLKFRKEFTKNDILTFKNSFSSFSRNIKRQDDKFNGLQTSSYSELSYLIKRSSNRFVSGLNLYSDGFKQKKDASTPLLNYSNYTVGLFLLDDWNVNNRLTFEPGFRVDYNSKYHAFLLPQAYFLYKFTPDLYVRAGGGFGYKIPSVFTSQSEEAAFINVLPIPGKTKAEKSAGVNIDFKYSKLFGNKLFIVFDQAFFYTRVNNGLVPQEDSLSAGKLFYINSPLVLDAKGFETRLHVSWKIIKLAADYSYTDAKRGNSFLELTPKQSIYLTAEAEKEHDWRVGLEAFYTGRQYLSDGSQSPDFWTMGVLLEKEFPHFSVAANVENMFDVRQTRFGPVVLPPYTSPTFKELYAPLSGRVINVMVKIKIMSFFNKKINEPADEDE